MGRASFDDNPTDAGRNESKHHRGLRQPDDVLTALRSVSWSTHPHTHTRGHSRHGRMHRRERSDQVSACCCRRAGIARPGHTAESSVIIGNERLFGLGLIAPNTPPSRSRDTRPSLRFLLVESDGDDATMTTTTTTRRRCH